MSAKKKVLTGVSYLAIAAVAVGGTMAFYQKETPTTTNVIMTDGNVDIVQIEQQRVDDDDNQTKLQDFVQGKQMLPAMYTGTSIPWAAEADWVVPGDQAWKVVEDNENVVDKFVTVKNTGSLPAYVRTVFAFEGGAYANDTMLHVITNGTNVSEEIGAWEWVEGVTIDGRQYDIAVCTYQKALQPGETTIPSLKQVYLDKAVTEKKAKELYGNSCDILVVSQACQTGMGTAKASLDEAFKPITATSHPWVDRVESTSGLIKTNEEFAAAVEAGYTTLMLDEGTFTLPTNLSGKKVTIYGTGEATVIDSTKSLGLNAVDGADIAFVNVKIQGVNANYIGYQHTARVTYANCVIDSRLTLYASEVVFTDCVFNGTGDYLWTYGANDVTFENCQFNNANSKAILVYQENDSVVSNVTVKNCIFTAKEKAYTGAGDWTAAVEIDSSLAPANVVIENCTIDGNYSGLVRHKSGSNAAITVDGAVIERPASDFIPDTSWYTEDASEYTISTASELFGFAQLVNDGNGFSGQTVKLDADIDLTGSEWTPIGQTGGYYANTYFQGTFDGQNHTITGLTITETNEGGNYAAGFFGFIDAASATIQNVNFTNANVNGHHWTGVVAGYLTGEITGCTVTNSTVTCTHANDEACGDKAGVIVGYVNSGTVTGNTAEDCTVTAGRDAGQIAGGAKTTQVSGNTVINVTVAAAGDCTGANINEAEIGRVL